MVLKKKKKIDERKSKEFVIAKINDIVNENEPLTKKNLLDGQRNSVRMQIKI